MKKTLFLLTFMIPLFTFAQTYVPAGPVSGTWGYGGSPYIILGDIQIEHTASLTIQAGVDVLFSDWYSLRVNGSLYALGSAANPVNFSTIDQGLYWHGIRIIDSKVTSRLEHCNIENAFAIMDPGYYPENCGGAIACFSSPLANIFIRDCKIHHNGAYDGGGIYASGANPVIENCDISRNNATYGGGISASDKSGASITNSLIAHNNAVYGGGINIHMAEPLVEGNKIIYNDASNCGGGMHVGISGKYSVSKNIIAFNTAVVGAGLHLSGSDGTYCNNTVAKNNASIKCGGVYLLGTSCPEIMNTIIFYNQAYGIAEGRQVYLQSEPCDPDFRFCNIEDGFPGFGGPGAGAAYTGVFEGNVYAYPLFANAAAGDFQITWDNYPWDDHTKSSCIDAGCPEVSNDPDQTCCDIGASYFFQLLEVPKALEPLVSPTHLYYRAYWTSAYGAKGYFLDVGLDPDFKDFLIQDLKLADTMYQDFVPAQGIYYYRVRAYNSAKTSQYSNVATIDFPVSIAEQSTAGPKVFSSGGQVYIELDAQPEQAASLKAYNLNGQLVAEQQIRGGMNRLEVNGADQMLILQIMLDGKHHQKKVLIR